MPSATEFFENDGRIRFFSDNFFTVYAKVNREIIVGSPTIPNVHALGALPSDGALT